jgi:hypothetical protein
MRFAVLLLTGVCALAADAAHPGLQQIHTVYLLPMANSLDQYMANRITAVGIFQVVTDPLKADAVFTDKIGEGLEEKLDELYPPEEKPKAKDDKDDKDDASGQPAKRFGSFSRGRGTVFLVDRRSRNVVWSTYWPVKSSRPDDTNRRASDIVKRLQKDLKPAGTPSS